MADWLHKYPGVAALLQQADDVLEGVSVEETPHWPHDDTPSPYPFASRAAMVDWRRRRAETDQPRT